MHASGQIDRQNGFRLGGYVGVVGKPNGQELVYSRRVWRTTFGIELLTPLIKGRYRNAFRLTELSDTLVRLLETLQTLDPSLAISGAGSFVHG